jgi:predicted metal-dependent hydrolase
MQLSLPLTAHAPDLGVEFVRHPRARRYVLRVGDDGIVRVTVPRWGSKRGGLEFAANERRWIEREWRRIQDRLARDLPHRRSADALTAVRDRARAELPPRLLELARAHRLNVSRISIRDQKWRWGSCARSGHICLNWRLVLMPDEVRDYVMIHELMHLKRMDHSPRFWKLVAAACPGYRMARRWLRQHGDELR